MKTTEKVGNKMRH